MTLPPKVGRVEAATAQISIYTWGTKANLTYRPQPMYLVDVSDWRNPGCNGKIRGNHQDGTAPAVIKWMEEDPKVGILSREIRRLATMQLMSKQKTGAVQTYISLGIIDHHGKWGAPAVAEAIARDLESYFRVGVSHACLPKT